MPDGFIKREVIVKIILAIIRRDGASAPSIPLKSTSPQSSCGSNSTVECLLPKQNVAGSIPVSRSLGAWRNWQTHTLQVRTKQFMWVQVPPRPRIIKIIPLKYLQD